MPAKRNPRSLLKRLLLAGFSAGPACGSAHTCAVGLCDLLECVTEQGVGVGIRCWRLRKGAHGRTHASFAPACVVLGASLHMTAVAAGGK
jgi:hypothetical protein